MKILDQLFDVYDKLQDLVLTPLKLTGRTDHHWSVRIASGVIVVLILIQLVFGFLWNTEPDEFRVVENAASFSSKFDENMVVGYVTVSSLIKIADTILDKPGGYLTNDKFPPGVFMDNIPNWEFVAYLC